MEGSLVLFVYGLLVVLFVAPNWPVLRMLTVIVAVLVALIASIDPIPMGLFAAVVLHTLLFFGIGAAIVALAGAKPDHKKSPAPPPDQD